MGRLALDNDSKKRYNQSTCVEVSYVPVAQLDRATAF